MTERLPGVLVVDKPAGMTSAQVVARVKRVLCARRTGHTGTLDPMATGVLPLCLGEATKLATYLLADRKAYEAELELGVETDSLDADGEVIACRPDAAARVDAAQLTRAMERMVGRIEQVPPMFSALRHRGKRLYELARAGEVVERAPRQVEIRRMSLIDFAPPRARFFVDCSKGTYVRALAADLGTALGCGAHLTALRRTRSGPFTIDQAIPLAEIDGHACLTGRLIDPADALAHLPGFSVVDEAVRAIGNGKPLPWNAAIAGEIRPPGEIFRLLTPAGALLALASVDAGCLRYARVFTYGLT